MNQIPQQFKKYEKTFHKNLQLLRDKGSYLIPFVTRPFFPENIEIFETKDNLPTISYEGRLVHSRRHPVKEAERFYASNKISPSDFIVLYGFGLG